MQLCVNVFPISSKWFQNEVFVKLWTIIAFPHLLTEHWVRSWQINNVIKEEKLTYLNLYTFDVYTLQTYHNLENSFQSQLKLTQSNDSINRRVFFEGSRFSRPQSPNWGTNSTNQMMYDLGLLLLYSTNSMHISLLRSLSNLYSCLHNSPKYLQHTCTSPLNQLLYIKFKPSVILLLKKTQTNSPSYSAPFSVESESRCYFST